MEFGGSPHGEEPHGGVSNHEGGITDHGRANAHRSYSSFRMLTMRKMMTTPIIMASISISALTAAKG